MIRRPWYRSPLLIFLAFFLLQWLLLFSLREPSWDAVGYYAYVRSAVFDRDLNFENDYQLSYPTSGEQFASKELDQILTATGRVENVFAIGAALLWLPWLSLLHVAAPFLLSAVSGFTGYEQFFVGNLAALSAILGFLAILLSFQTAEKVTNRRLALVSALTLMFTTPLIFYQFRDPLYSHTSSAFAVSLCVFFWMSNYDRVGTIWRALTLGALIGLAGLVRWQNLTYLSLPAISAILLWLKQPDKRDPKGGAKALFYLLLTVAAALVVFSPQLATWKVLYGSFITIPQGDAFLSWRPIFLAPFLFSPFRGVLFWMPIFFLAFIGLIVLSKHNTQAGLPLLIMLLLALYVNGGTHDWFAGAGFGPRRLTSEFIIFVIGYAVLLKSLPQRIRSWVAIIVGIGLAFHQWVLLRFALPEGIGGKVLSMSPTYTWQDDPLPQFISDLSALAVRAVQSPADSLVNPGSPLDLLLNQHVWPVQHAGVLVASASFILIIIAGWLLLKNHWQPKAHGLALIIIVVVLGLINFWILTGA